MKKPILLIDGDQFVYKAAAAVEREVKWDDQNHVLYSNMEEAWRNLTDMLNRLFERFETREHALTFSSAPNFRHSIDPTYKNKRAGTRKPLCYADMREKCEGEYKCVALPGLEADDVMGILATKPGTSDRIIISQDKDMRTIPGKLWNGKDMINVSEDEADYFHLYQTLIGDASDGYKGCPGIGPKKAEKVLDEIERFNSPTRVIEVWNAVVDAYEKCGLTEADAITQARLARILRWTDWDQAKKEPILWKPK